MATPRARSCSSRSTRSTSACGRSGSTSLPESWPAMKIERMGPEDQERVMAAGNLFDYPPRSDAVNRFLADPNHHLLIAYSGDFPAGFISGVETTHPDKGTEMFLYELAVAPKHRNQGIGRKLVGALAELARQRGCYGMSVGTEPDNAAALATYSAAGASPPEAFVTLEWVFSSPSSPEP